MDACEILGVWNGKPTIDSQVSHTVFQLSAFCVVRVEFSFEIRSGWINWLIERTGIYDALVVLLFFFLFFLSSRFLCFRLSLLSLSILLFSRSKFLCLLFSPSLFLSSPTSSSIAPMVFKGPGRVAFKIGRCSFPFSIFFWWSIFGQTFCHVFWFFVLVAFSVFLVGGNQHHARFSKFLVDLFLQKSSSMSLSTKNQVRW